jgi:hypothetical protein
MIFAMWDLHQFSIPADDVGRSIGRRPGTPVGNRIGAMPGVRARSQWIGTARVASNELEIMTGALPSEPARLLFSAKAT